MRSTVIIQFLFAIMTVHASAQVPQTRDFMKQIGDSFNELEGNLTLYFFNALNGEPIQNGVVQMLDIGQFETDEEGKILFPIPDDPSANIPVGFLARGFVDTDFTLELEAGTLFLNRFSVSPKIDIKHVRFVLDWGEKPKDLDAHLVKRGDYHISYRDKRKLADGTAELDRDDTNGFGPETITVKKISPDAVYDYYIHDYSDRSDSKTENLSKSRAVVKVFGEGKLLHNIRVPQDGKGNVWKVLEIRKGKVVLVSNITQ
tara:strand:+ start:697 stop:1473 length:777 start_codon:yes stop_codon:yes gene_type:complete